MIRAADYRRGEQVTDQPAAWFDGTPVAGWPDPQYIYTVLAARRIRGVAYLRVCSATRKPFLLLQARARRISPH